MELTGIRARPQRSRRWAKAAVPQSLPTTSRSAMGIYGEQNPCEGKSGRCGSPIIRRGVHLCARKMQARCAAFWSLQKQESPRHTPFASKANPHQKRGAKCACPSAPQASRQPRARRSTRSAAVLERLAHATHTCPEALTGSTHTQAAATALLLSTSCSSQRLHDNAKLQKRPPCSSEYLFVPAASPGRTKCR